MKNILFPLMLMGLILGSCSVEKRLHNKGFHISANAPTWKGKKSKKAQKAVPDLAVKGAKTDGDHIESLNITEAPADSCDKIITKGGDVIEAKVMEYWYDKIRYKKCENLKNPSQLIQSEEVFMIIYADGRKEVVSTVEKMLKPDSIPAEEELIPSSSVEENENIPLPKEKLNRIKCDQIIFPDGESKEVKVVEISDDQIKFRICSDEDGPIFVKKKTDITLVHYANGKSEKMGGVNSNASDDTIEDFELYRKTDISKTHEIIKKDEYIEEKGRSSIVFTAIILGAIMALLGIMFAVPEAIVFVPTLFLFIIATILFFINIKKYKRIKNLASLRLTQALLYIISIATSIALGLYYFEAF